MNRIDAHLHDTLLEVFLAAERQWWLKRAQDFENARPRPGRDYAGNASIEDLRAQWVALTAVAKACYARAEVAPLDLATDVANVLEETAS